ncbi:MAG TPA: hypoxanthine phosphoribosyltransferase [Syntrophales bacterium]|nr:hypoxanthine phosphoribosyltransferase [Syntrophales bacterium]HOM07520.1 hypoxanthine phosphoribosyltransferase [Syntrophales bacterium]HON99847.1 hypoxanthine phosphoribosyltransferase [Syntrophales bacterium]HPC01436.1 hypoxanthine phosphoribosyltransferase [Syntrophales bacterium]HPQ07135.1 hypoxanthine phosphoribosyltransferase [Syntrophales bacterium]
MEEMKKEVLFGRDLIAKRVEELAAQISRDYRGREPVVVGVMKGAFIFMADLIRRLDIPCVVDFVRLRSYGSSSVSSGRIELTKDVETDVAGRDVLIVEDIVDTGLTLTYLVEVMRARKPASLKVCAFIDKRLRREVPFEADYVGFTMDDGFVIGYGLDFNEQGRFLPDVFIVRDL